MIRKTDTSFADVLARVDGKKLEQDFLAVTPEAVLHSIQRAKNEEWLQSEDLIALLSPAAAYYIEEMAQVAARLHLKYFGKAITLYQPLYIANYCENQCLYCGFSSKNQIERKQLTFEQIENEARAIAADGEVKQILILTGEAPKRSGFEYILGAVEIMKRYFSSISIEVYPMETQEYRRLKEAGVDGLTIYQETYNRENYLKYHPSGRKGDFDWRLATPQRGAEAALRAIGIGALYGLSNCNFDAFCTALHGRYLSDRFLDVEFSLSLPRIQPASGGFQCEQVMDDTSFIQTFLAFRLFLPRVGINVSTRESQALRDSLLGLGVSRLSAGSKTSVGGYDREHLTEDQFDVADSRSVAQVKADLKSMGYQPVHKDWELFV